MGSCKSELRITFPIKVSWSFAIWFWVVGMLKNLPLTSELFILYSFKTVAESGGVRFFKKYEQIQKIDMHGPSALLKKCGERMR